MVIIKIKVEDYGDGDDDHHNIDKNYKNDKDIDSHDDDDGGDDVFNVDDVDDDYYYYDYVGYNDDYKD
jgi:hypothetical protein